MSINALIESSTINKYIEFKNKRLLFQPDISLKFNAHTHLCRANWKPSNSNHGSFIKSIMRYRAQQTEAEIINGNIKAISHMINEGLLGYISHQNHRHLRSVIKAVKSFPLNHNYVRMCTDNPDAPSNFRERPLQAIKETISLAKKFPDVGIFFGPNSLFDCSLEMFEAYGSIFKENYILGLQTHVAEDLNITNQIKKRLKKSEIEFLFEAGCLNNHTFLVHCTYITERDIELILYSGAKVVICPRSSFNPDTFLKCIRKWVPIYIGTDAYNLYHESLGDELAFLIKVYNG